MSRKSGHAPAEAQQSSRRARVLSNKQTGIELFKYSTRQLAITHSAEIMFVIIYDVNRAPKARGDRQLGDVQQVVARANYRRHWLGRPRGQVARQRPSPA